METRAVGIRISGEWLAETKGEREGDLESSEEAHPAERGQAKLLLK